MRSRSTRWAALALGAAAAGWLLRPGAARAQDAAATEDEIGPEAGTKRPAGPDERSGHILIQGRAGYVAPFGSIATDLPASSVVVGGPALGVHLGLGLSRATVLDLSGDYAFLSPSARCDGCSGRSLDLGLGLVYHAAQGIAFDPWVGYGIGYRMATYEGLAKIRSADVAFPDAAFHGLDFVRIALGGDFYPVPYLGFGPFLELDLGTFISRPEGFGQTVYGFFQAGLRISLDPVPRPAPRTAGSPGGAPRPRALRTAAPGAGAGI